MTYDFLFAKREDAVDFIVAVSTYARKANPELMVGVTNKGMVTTMLLKAKLAKMAKV